MRPALEHVPGSRHALPATLASPRDRDWEGGGEVAPRLPAELCFVVAAANGLNQNESMTTDLLLTNQTQERGEMEMETKMETETGTSVVSNTHFWSTCICLLVSFFICSLFFSLAFPGVSISPRQTSIRGPTSYNRHQQRVNVPCFVDRWPGTKWERPLAGRSHAAKA